MTTISAVPTPPRAASSERPRPPFEQRMRSVLRDDTAWAQLVADLKGRNDAEQWLKTTATSIDNQLALRQSQVEQAAQHPEDPESLSRAAEYHRWRRAALYMKSLCEQRIIALKRLQADDESRADQLLDLLLELGREVLAAPDDATASELHPALDRIFLPGSERITLRQRLQDA